MSNILHKEYPFLLTKRENRILRIILATFVFLAVIILRPFELADFDTEALLLTAFINALFIYISLAISNAIFRYFNPDISENDWTVLKEIVSFLWHILFIGFLSYFFNRFVTENYDLEFWLERSVIRPIIGAIILLPLVLLVKGFFVLRRMKSLLDAVNAIRRKEPSPVDDAILTFEEDKMDQKLDVSVRDLILISSEGNYVQLHYMQNDKLKKKLLRKTLKDTRQYLSPYNSFFQCHRSYIVNIDKIISYKGNAKGFRASLKHLDFKVPISRVYIDIFKERLVQNKQP